MRKLIASILTSLFLGAGPACPKVVALGDSVTIGNPYTLADPWPNKLSALLPVHMRVDNYAVSGQTVIEVYNSQYVAQVQGNGFTVVLILAGVNDLIASDSGLQAFNRLKTMTDAIEAEGHTPVVGTVTPWKAYGFWSSAKQTQTEDLNSRIRAWGNGSTRFVVDLYTAMESSTGSQTLAASYDGGDGLHPSNAGAAKIAAMFRSVFWFGG